MFLWNACSLGELNEIYVEFMKFSKGLTARIEFLHSLKCTSIVIVIIDVTIFLCVYWEFITHHHTFIIIKFYNIPIYHGMIVHVTKSFTMNLMQ